MEFNKNDFVPLDKKSFDNVSKDCESYKLIDKHLREQDSIDKYLNLIYIPFKECKRFKKLKLNNKDTKYGPFFYFKINKGNNKCYINNKPVYSYYDFYKFNRGYPRYSLKYILDVYISQELNIDIDFDIIDSPFTKNSFLIRIIDQNGKGHYARSIDNNNEFQKNKDGYIEAATALYLFYNKYIPSRKWII